MPRRKQCRCLFEPSVLYFKPRGIRLRHLTEEVLFPYELEALKLHDVDGLQQVEAAEKMGISQPTFARILDKTYKKIARALIGGKAIVIQEK